MRSVDLSPKGIGRVVARLGAAGQNALEVARFGGLDTDEDPSPYEVVTEQRVYRLRRYFPDAMRAEGAPPVLLVPPMMLAAEVYDVSPASSAVADLLANGVDPWVVDFGAPEREQGGLERTLTDHVVAVSDAIDRVRESTGRGVHLSGYSQGGMFCYQAAAFRRADGVDSVITFGSPVDMHGMLPFDVPEEVITRVAGFLGDRVLGRYALPAWASRNGFRLLDPLKFVRQRADFVRQLHNREALLPREGQRRFLEAEGWVAWPGPALAELARQFVATNRMLSGGFVIDDRMVTLADLVCPLLCFVGEVDEIAPPPVVRAIKRAAPRADVYETSLRAGHFGLVVGGGASDTTWPTVAEWCRWRDAGGDGPPPEVVHRMPDDDGSSTDDPGALARLGHLAGLAAEVGGGMARSLQTAARRTGRAFQEVAAESVEVLPRLGRLDRTNPRTRVSLGLLLDEQAARMPDATFFVFEGRGHTYAAAKRRIDNIVRGLISVGVRQGEHVGVLMSTRPSAVAVVAALSRLGAVVVLLRPDGELRREAELGHVTRIIADPEHGELATEAAVPTLVLGGGGEPRELGFGLFDMERIDPDEVAVPAWYTPNPGRARDLAFILFTGHGDRVRMNRLTNSRWALSAFGTATSAALSTSDTVYSVTPIHHPSGLLTSIGGAVAGGARLALATSFDPSTFWDEVRRYGVTIVSYTWALVQPLLDAPPDPAERHHPVRLFIGSGMPVSLWRRVLARFRPAGVLEFYASTEGEAVLVNVTGAKVGSKGRPLPGSVGVRIARYDTARGRLEEGPDGFAVPCSRGEVGMLLARVRDDRGGLLGTPLRGVFAKGDEWQVTGDLFRRDDDGDFWWVDHVQALVPTASGLVPSIPIEDALGWVEAVDLAIAYGLPAASGHEIVVAAVTARTGFEVSADDLTAALKGLAAEVRPAVVRVVDRIPLTTWHRPLKAPVRDEGVSAGDGYVWEAATDSYRPLTDDDVVALGLATQPSPSR